MVKTRTASKQSWNLESFLDSLILELDKAQDTLSVKGINRKLTYTVKDVALDLNVFPEYQKHGIRFTTAKPGETGASRLSLQLGSISDRQIHETTKQPLSADDVAIETLDEIDEDTKASLRKMGVTSADDLERMRERNVDIEEVVAEKAESPQKVNYNKLAGIINKARRRRLSPSLSRISMQRALDGHELLTVQGQNLVVSQGFPAFPAAYWNDREVRIVAADHEHITLDMEPNQCASGAHQLHLVLDPYAVMSLEVRT